MLWIKNNESLPPKEWIHDLSLKNKDGNTLAMQWILKYNKLPPKEIAYDKEACGSLYIESCKNIPLEEWEQNRDLREKYEWQNVCHALDDMFS